MLDNAIETETKLKVKIFNSDADCEAEIDKCLISILESASKREIEGDLPLRVEIRALPAFFDPKSSYHKLI